MTDTKPSLSFSEVTNENCEIFPEFFFLFQFRNTVNDFLSILIDFKENSYQRSILRIAEFNHRHFLKMGGNLDISEFIEKEVVLMVPRRCY